MFQKFENQNHRNSTVQLRLDEVTPNETHSRHACPQERLTRAHGCAPYRACNSWVYKLPRRRVFYGRVSQERVSQERVSQERVSQERVSQERVSQERVSQERASHYHESRKRVLH